MANAQRRFSGGEIAPELYSACDMVKYATGLRTLRNFIILRHGGASNRAGTKHICEVKNSSKKVKLIPFVFNNDQTYIIEFGEGYIRYVRNDAQITEAAKTITGITQATEAVVTSAAHGFSNGDELFIDAIVGMTELNGRNVIVSNSATNTFKIKDLYGNYIDSTAFTAYASAGTASRIYKITNTYTEAELPEIKYVQSADVISLVNSNHKPAQLSRIAHNNWTLADISFEPEVDPPTAVTGTGAAGAVWYYVVTSIDPDTFEESLISNVYATSLVPTTGTANTISWTAASGVTTYNIYKGQFGIYGLIGSSASTSFIDNGIVPDYQDTTPIARNPFNASGDYPTCIAYIQQRLALGGSDNDPERIYLSRSGQFNNFTNRFPNQDDDAIDFNLTGSKVSKVNHLLSLLKPVVFTESGEHILNGDSAGILKPTEINPEQHSYNGSSQNLSPIVIGATALYVQSRGSVVRDLGYEFETSGYRGNDLTIFSSHLFDGYTIVDWAYQQIPHSIIWAVRDDGVLLGLTYIREQQIWGWHRHDFENGFVENVAVIPDGNEDAVYLTIKRTINGVTKRYIEKLTSRLDTDIEDMIFLDSALTFDGRNTNDSLSMTISGGTTWDHTETLTLTASSSYFLQEYEGQEIHLNIGSETVRFRLETYSSGTVMTGSVYSTVPTAFRSVATTDWGRAVSTVTGLYHLEGEQVSIFGDGSVLASVNNPTYPEKTVSGGSVSFDKAHVVVHVGLPITSDLETLDIDNPQGDTLMDKRKLICEVSVSLKKTRGVFVGSEPPSDDDTDPLEGLSELKSRSTETYGTTPLLKTEVVNKTIQSRWNNNGRVFLRQVDPLPVTVTSIVPSGLMGG